MTIEVVHIVLQSAIQMMCSWRYHLGKATVCYIVTIPCIIMFSSSRWDWCIGQCKKSRSYRAWTE